MTSPVVVGIDGSEPSLSAALWAVDEARSRGAPLLLVHAVSGSDHDLDETMRAGEDLVESTRLEVLANTGTVDVQTAVESGDPVDVLVHLSRTAQMVCVGWAGTQPIIGDGEESTVNRVVRGALAPVAVVRRRHPLEPPPPGRWIVALLDESSDSTMVLDAAITEAKLRQAPIFALTSWPTDSTPSASESAESVQSRVARYLEQSHHGDAAVDVCAVPAPTHLHRLLEQSAGIDQLVVVGGGDDHLITELLGADARSIMRDSNCSVLIVRRHVGVPVRSE